MRKLQLKLVATLGAILAAALTVVTPAATAAPSSSTSHGSTTTKDPSSGAAARHLTFGIGPAFPVASTQVVDGRPFIDVLATPGGTVNDAVAIFNVGSQPVHLSVYTADATDTSAGDFTLLPQAAKRTDAATWIRLHLPAGGTITVPPRHGKTYGRVVVPFTAKIPASASPGDHVAGILASLVSVSKNKQGARVRLDQRIGVRTYFHLAGPVHPQVAIEQLRTTYHRAAGVRGDGTLSISYVVHNTGDLLVNVSPLVSVSRWFLSTVHTYPPGVSALLPGAKVRLSQTIPDLTGIGPMRTTVMLFATPVDTAIAAHAPPVSADATVWAWPWLFFLVLGVLLLLLLLGGGWWWRRHRRRTQLAEPTKPASGPQKKEPVLAPRSSTAS